jgi:hypothetical protein
METIGYLDCGWEGVFVTDICGRETTFLYDAESRFKGRKVKITVEPIP